MLGRCSQEPLTFKERFALLSQEILERNAFLMYMTAKRFLHKYRPAWHPGRTAARRSVVTGDTRKL
jgi:hypothetical protein